MSIFSGKYKPRQKKTLSPDVMVDELNSPNVSVQMQTCELLMDISANETGYYFGRNCFYHAFFA